MIKTEYIEKEITTRNIKKWSKLLNDDFVVSEIIKIPIKYIGKQSHEIVKCECDICNEIQDIYYYNYITQIKKHNIYCCSQKCAHIKNKLTNIEKYGVDYSQSLDVVKQKVKKTKLERYGDENYCNPEKTKKTKLERYGDEYYVNFEKMVKTKIKLGWQVSTEDKTDFEKYRLKITTLTKKVKKELFNNWNGSDYYDGEYIAENLTLKYTDKDFPTIDHKTSVSYGFKNNISAEEISLLSNLCITKRSINSSKGSKNEY